MLLKVTAIYLLVIEMLTYSDLILLKTFEERLDYLRVDGLPSEITFGPLRKLNQRFYNSPAWKRVRDEVISRDLGFDLGVPGYDIFGKVLVHHMNPLRPKDLVYNTSYALDPEFLITVSNDTHLSIHFGYEVDPPMEIERFKGDTKLW